MKLNKRKPKVRIKANEEKQLNERQELFCVTYVNQEIPNISEAYRKAGYNGNNVCSAAVNLFRQPHITARIQELRKERMQRLKTDGDEVVRRLLLLASSNIKDYLEYDGFSIRIKPSEELTREQAFCIHEIKERILADGSRSIEFKLHDKRSPLQLLAQHFGLLDGSGGAQDPVQRAKDFKRQLDSMLGSVSLEPEGQEQGNS